jgi:hypothetical protein
MNVAFRSLVLLLACISPVTGFLVSTTQQPSSQTKLDVNDVSFLWPVPTAKEHVARLISSNERTADGSEIWPAALFKSVVESAKNTSVQDSAGGQNKINFGQFEKMFLQPDTWKVVAFRVDPSAPGAHPDLIKVFGSVPQIRIILQPVTVEGGGRIRVHDLTAHLVFSYVKGVDPSPPFVPDKEKFGDIVKDLQSLKAAATSVGVTTAGSLGVHPALKAGVPGFADQVKTFLAKHVSPSRLMAVSFMGLDPPEPWIFFALSRNSDGTMREAPQKVLGGKHAQMLTFRGGTHVMPVPSPTNVTAGNGVSTGVLFRNDHAAKLEDPVLSGLARPLHREIPDLVANPQRAQFFNTDCLSCHTESSRRKELKLPPSDERFRFAPPAGISGGDEALLPQSQWNVRNFGWFQQRPTDPIAPTVTVRTANEAAESAEFINREYLSPP